MKHRKGLFVPALLVALFAMGCQSQIPLFNSEARPLNRIYSGKEIITELNLQAADFIARGWVTQEFVDKNVGPSLDRAADTLNGAEALYKSGDIGGANSKIESAKATLGAVREGLIAIQRSRQ